MKKHKITKKEDIENLMETYSDNTVFKVIETNEEITLTDFLYLYDNQQITIQQI